MDKEYPFKCKMPGCDNGCDRLPHVCDKHFIEGWGRLPWMPLPEEAPLYVSDKPKVTRKRKKK